MRACDIFPTQAGLEVQVPDINMGVLKDADRIADTVPVAAAGWARDRALSVVRKHWSAHRAAGRPAAERPFAPSGQRAPLSLRNTTQWWWDLLALVTVRAPPGTKWSGHSLRSGSAMKGQAMGPSDALLWQLIGLADSKTAYADYIDATPAGSKAAWGWFGWLAVQSKISGGPAGTASGRAARTQTPPPAPFAPYHRRTPPTGHRRHATKRASPPAHHVAAVAVTAAARARTWH